MQFFTLSSDQRPWLPVTGCGCYDGEGYYPISPLDDISPCFLNGIVLNVFNFVMIIAGVVTHVRLRRKKLIGGSMLPWFKAKIALAGLQIVFQAMLIVASALEFQYPEGVDIRMDVTWWGNVSTLVAFYVMFCDAYLEFFKSYVNSTTVIVYWFLYCVIALLRVIGVYLRHYSVHITFLTVATAVNAIPILLLEIMYQPTPPPEKDHTRYNPRDYANTFSRLVFSWFSPVMKKGYSKYLTLKDLPPLPIPMRSDRVAVRLTETWDDQLKKNPQSPSLFISLIKAFGKPFFIGGLFELAKDIVRFQQRPVLKYLIQFVEDYTHSNGGVPMTRGYMLVLLMFAMSVMETLLLHSYIERTMDTGMEVRSALSCMVYKKSLVLSVQSRQAAATGDIVNLMSVDSERLQFVCYNLQVIWSGPFQIFLALWYLYKLMGNAMWIGFFVMVLAGPVNTELTKRMRALQKLQMAVKDKRSRLTSEILNNVKSLKLYAWEDPYKKKLLDIRNNEELANLKTIGLLNAIYQFIFNMIPSLVSSSTFAMFIILYSTPLSPDVAFPALALFNLLEFPLNMIPQAVNDVVEASVSIGRLTKFFMAEEIDKKAVRRTHRTKNEEFAVEVDDASFLWSRTPYRCAISHLTYTAAPASLSCIVGRVGAGKSALLRGILGDLYNDGGSVTLKGPIAYVPQNPWIMNGTIKDNILFGFKEKPAFYEKVVKYCALDVDMSSLPDGDATQVGEKGISLSGGQKARLSLARAVYAGADIYFIDDVLSSVDEHVGRHLIMNVLGPNGILKGKCKVLVTNNLHVLKYSQKITMLESGAVAEEGSYTGLKEKRDSKLYALLEEFGSSKDQQDDIPVTLQRKKGHDLLRPATLDNYHEVVERAEENSEQVGRDEKTKQGGVDWHVYWYYLDSCGVGNVILFFITLILSKLLGVLASFWLKHWSEMNDFAGKNVHPWRNLLVYFGLDLLGGLSTLTQNFIQWLQCSVTGSKVLYEGMLQSVLRAPMEFFEITPVGRILNRFSSDIFKIDESMFRVFANFFGSLVNVLFILMIIVFSSWRFIFVIIPLSFIYKYLQEYYLLTSRELRRLDGVTRSPIYSHFQETLNGVETIRAYAQVNRFLFLNHHNMDTNIGVFHPAMTANRWLSIRLEFIASVVILTASALLVYTLPGGRVTGGLVGLTISYALQITESLGRLVRMSARIESDIVSVERVKEYSSLKPEAPYRIADAVMPAEWPSNGCVAFKEYSARYREGLELVLKNVTFAVKEKEKIGIVGRTGAGKSSLTLALFRIIESANGYIDIDKVDTHKIGLYDLRSRLSIIPQDSQVFQGTIRSNLDPTDQFTDPEIWEALRLAHLDRHIINMLKDVPDPDAIQGNPLSVPLAEGGSNLSMGQRQLMCLARALCKRNSRVLVLDEATANVDVETDAIVQSTIRSEFKDKTILTIAHRLNTIIDSDRILVLDHGEVAEFDTPTSLINNRKSLFYSLCKEGGIIDINGKIKLKGVKKAPEEKEAE